MNNMNRRPRTSLDYQRLEPKHLLAGNVSVSLVGETLNVAGDSLANEIQILGSPNGSVSIVPVDGTTINNQTQPFSIGGGIKYANFRMGAGDDLIEISNIQMADVFAINLENGNDHLAIDGINVRYLLVSGGAGHDVMEFHNTYSRKEIHIQGNAGDNTVSITSMAADRSVYVETDSGADTIGVNNLGVRKSVSVKSGAGNDLVAVTGRLYSNNTKFELGDGNDGLSVLPNTNQTTATVRRGLEVKAGSGNDQVAIGQGAESERRTDLAGEAGNDSLNTTNSALRNPKISGFENFQLPNQATALDSFYARLDSAGVDTTPFGRDMEVTPAPVLATSDTPLQLERSATAVPVDDQLSLTGEDVDVSGATVAVSTYIADEDVLAFTDTDGIAGSFDTTTGVLTLSGTATLAEYQAALRTVTYDNTNGAFTGSKQVEFVVTSEAGTAQDSREVQILTDDQAIENFAADNGLVLEQTPSGVQYIIETPGNDVQPTVDDSVRVDYRGTLLDRTEFDANDDATFPLVGVIPGFRDGLLEFSEGASGQIFIPAELGYGEDGTTNIPPDAILRFEIELLEVILTA